MSDQSLLADLAADLLGEDPLGRFEAVAEEFCRDTGYLRPGKSYPTEAQCFDEQARYAAWNTWVHARSRRQGAMLRALLGEVPQIVAWLRSEGPGSPADAWGSCFCGGSEFSCTADSIERGVHRRPTP